MATSQQQIIDIPVMNQFTRHGIQDPDEMLANMQACRHTMLKVLTEGTTSGPAYRKIEQVVESLDDLIEEIAGNRDCLWKGIR